MNIFQQLKEKKVLDKDGKVDALGPYGKQKLTGSEVALDLGGAMSVAQKEIKKFYGSKILNSREVKNALKFANESYEYNNAAANLEEGFFAEETAFEAMQDIVKNKQAKKVKGVMVDMFTASVITQAYDKVNDSNKKKIEKAKLEQLVKMAHKVMGMKTKMESVIAEGKMGALLLDIQQGATAKELAKDYKIPLDVAKDFLKDYYMQKRDNRKAYA